MPPQLQPVRMKAVISVTSMAEAVGMSRAAFYAHIARGVFIPPLYAISNRRPFYTMEMQKEIIAVRESGIGSNNEYVLFYERRKEGPLASRGRHCSQPQSNVHDGLLGGLKSLGMQGVTPAQIEAAIVVCFPQGTTGMDESTLLRAVFRHLRRTGGWINTAALVAFYGSCGVRRRSGAALIGVKRTSKAGKDRSNADIRAL